MVAFKVAIVSAIWAVLLLISSALVADTVRTYETKNTYTFLGRRGSVIVCDVLDLGKTDYQCGHLIGGTVSQSHFILYYSIRAVGEGQAGGAATGSKFRTT